MHPLFEHADGVLNALLSSSAQPWQSSAPRPFVTVSREAGSGGASLARTLARKLNSQAPLGVTWRVIEDNITSIMLREQGLASDIARFLPEDKTPEILSMLGEMVGLHPNIWGLLEKIRATQRSLAREGYVILVGRCAHLATADLAGGYHVRTIAPLAHRIRLLSEMYHLSEDEASRHIRRCDRARELYSRQHYSASLQSPHQYDVVINTATTAPSLAAERIARDLRTEYPHWLEIPPSQAALPLQFA